MMNQAQRRCRIPFLAHSWLSNQQCAIPTRGVICQMAARREERTGVCVSDVFRPLPTSLFKCFSYERTAAPPLAGAQTAGLCLAMQPSRRSWTHQTSLKPLKCRAINSAVFARARHGTLRGGSGFLFSSFLIRGCERNKPRCLVHL